jgi:site-specific DNA recombinase
VMARFAFYGRVSTEDQQDPEASRTWQIARARALSERHGEIVPEFSTLGSRARSRGNADLKQPCCSMR